MTRRVLLGFLAAAAAEAADPERLLWRPKLISIPKPNPVLAVPGLYAVFWQETGEPRMSLIRPGRSLTIYDLTRNGPIMEPGVYPAEWKDGKAEWTVGERDAARSLRLGKRVTHIPPGPHDPNQVAPRGARLSLRLDQANPDY